MLDVVTTADDFDVLWDPVLLADVALEEDGVGHCGSGPPPGAFRVPFLPQ